MVNLKDRVGRLEQRLDASPNQAQIEEDARFVNERLLGYADRFADTDGGLSISDLLAKSPAQHFAWTLRFRPDQADVGALMALHGFDLPQGTAAGARA